MLLRRDDVKGVIIDELVIVGIDVDVVVGFDIFKVMINGITIAAMNNPQITVPAITTAAIYLLFDHVDF